MKFSREFVRAVNSPGSSPELKRLREIVEEWARKRKMPRQAVEWLEKTHVHHFVTLRPGGKDQVRASRHFQQSVSTAETAVASFVEFLAEEAESLASGTGNLAVQVCPVCGDICVQEEGGRRRLYCSRRCMFRSRRATEKAARVVVVKQLAALRRKGVVPADCSLEEAIQIMAKAAEEDGAKEARDGAKEKKESATKKATSGRTPAKR